jgi:hypothetical protein
MPWMRWLLTYYTQHGPQSGSRWQCSQNILQDLINSVQDILEEPPPSQQREEVTDGLHGLCTGAIEASATFKSTTYTNTMNEKMTNTGYSVTDARRTNTSQGERMNDAWETNGSQHDKLTDPRKTSRSWQEKENTSTSITPPSHI